MDQPIDPTERGRAWRETLLALLGVQQPTAVAVVMRIGAPVPRSKATVPPARGADMATQRMSFNQECLVEIGNIQPRGARFDGAPTWESSDPSIVDIRPGADGMSALVGSSGVEGVATITVTADARLGEEVVPVVGTATVAVYPPDVTMFDLVLGAVRDRTDDDGTGTTAPPAGGDVVEPVPAPDDLPADAPDPSASDPTPDTAIVGAPADTTNP